jgi:Zn-dependent protease with chaperone function
VGLSISFLLGIVVLLGYEQLCEVLPGAATPWKLWVALLAVPVPALLLPRLVAFARRLVIAGRVRLGRALIALAPLSVPLTYAGMVGFGDLPAVVGEFAGAANALFLAVGLAPLLALELGFRRAQIRLARTAAGSLLLPPLPTHFGMIGVLLVPLLCTAGLLDLTAANRTLHVFLTATVLGHLATFALGVGLFVVAIPLLFRWLLPISRTLPAHLAPALHDTAAALGFSPRAVVALRTDLRLPNAAMVGFLPWPRYLVLTDALMGLLDAFALRGVIAHEVGHARAGHPGYLVLLMAVVPVLLAYPAQLFCADFAKGFCVILALTAAAALLFGLHRVAHRFEHEADVQSAIALGGARPCIDALQRVASIVDRSPNRASLMHPSDRRRVEALVRWEQDPAERAAFARRGRRLRVTLLLLAGGAAVACGWSLKRLAPLDFAVLAYARGDFPAARTRLAEFGAEPSAWLVELRDELRQQLDAASALVPGGGRWEAIRDRLAEGGIERGVGLLQSGDPKAALPWLALALSRPDSEPWRATLHRLADAAAQGDAARVERLRNHLRWLESPPDVIAAVADVRAIERRP